jgi:prepilin-type processing-associated H-X9-DG protein
MYKIIGADGKEYGPITATQLRQWITQGRACATTKVKLEADSDWQTLDSLPEFAEALSLPPSLPNLPPRPPAPAKLSRLAITSLVLGVLGIFSCGITAIVGLVLGIVSLVQISKSQGRLKGQGLAIGGIIASALFLFVAPAMLLPALAKAKAKAQSINCMNNVRQITLAVVLHAQSNTNSYPPAATWCDAIQTEIGSDKVLQCVAGDKEHRCHYAFNAKLDGLTLDLVRNPAQTVMVFETDGGWNLSGGRELLPKKTRHGRAVAIGFVDGHAEMVAESRLSQLEWEP